MLSISLIWGTLVGVLGYSEERVWNSFFLQYLWVFCLGMKLAELYHKRPGAFNVQKWKYLIPAFITGVALTGIMGWFGYPWKLYNDIPSLIGYMSLALMFYKININVLNRFLCFTNTFSYEWYLIHILVFSIIRHFSSGHIPECMEIPICFIVSYLAAVGYAKVFKLTCYKKN